MLAVGLPRLRLSESEAQAPRASFPSGARLGVEIGFGGGEHARALVAGDPGLALIACEVFENGLCSLLSALLPEGEEATAPPPPRLRLWPDDARHLLRLLPAGCLDVAYLMFPDPWPKARHAKRRFVHPDNVALVARALAPGGVWRIATDDPTYQTWITAVMQSQSGFAPPRTAERRPAGWPPTRYETKALQAGRRPLYWSFRRLAS